jgi:hypothetical protein
MTAKISKTLPNFGMDSPKLWASEHYNSPSTS